MREHTRFFGLLALPALLLAACAPEGQDGATTGAEADAAEAPPTQRPTTQPGFSDWDMDGDASLNEQEFGQWAREEGPFGTWFGEEGVDFDQIHQDLHSAMDMNSDGTVDESDWSAGIRELFGNEDPGQWSEWDTNGDGQLDEEEFTQAIQTSGLQERMDEDGDGTVTEAEVQTFFFGLMDRNDDGRLDTTEWNSGRETWFGDDGMM